jgi:hypothetical protein
MLSMLQQMLLEDKDNTVKEAVVRSLALIVTFMHDKDKYFQVSSIVRTMQPTFDFHVVLIVWNNIL